MRASAALLAAVALFAVQGGCEGDDGAEPGASQEAALVLDFVPNAVHAGIYTAQHNGYFDDEGVELTVREPGASTDGPKLLEAGRVQFAILDIHDLAIARERGSDLVAVAPVVQRPLAAVIAGDRNAIQTAAELEGASVGVTGLPSDDAVLDSVLEEAGVDPGSVERVTIGFEAVRALAAGRIDAATAFWNAEGVALRRRGVPTREFRVDNFGAPHYPELVVVSNRETLETDPGLVDAVVAGLTRGYEAVADDPVAGLDALLTEAEGLDPAEQQAQLDALIAADAFEPPGVFNRGPLEDWAAWDADHGIVESPPRVSKTFDLTR